jgi:hypothetical protein
MISTSITFVMFQKQITIFLPKNTKTVVYRNWQERKFTLVINDVKTKLGAHMMETHDLTQPPYGAA